MYTYLKVKLLFDFVKRPTVKEPEKSKQKYSPRNEEPLGGKRKRNSVSRGADEA